jgi:UDP-glucose 4-epimerase
VTAQRALVTGGAGFIGSHVAEAFRADGYTVTVLDNLSSGRRENVPVGTTLVEMDVTTPEAGAFVSAQRFDVIAHLAAQIDVRRSVADPVFDAGVNVLGTLRMLEAVRASRAATRVILASTGGALYGDFATPPNAESVAKDPESPYGIAKLSAEYYLAYYARVHGLDTVALRFANVYGPRQDPHGEAGVVAIFCGRLLDGRPVTIFGDGRQTRDYVYVKDVAQANLAAARSTLPAAGRLDARAFNVGTAIETSVNDLAATLGSAAGRAPTIEYAPARPGEQMRSAVVVDKAGTVLKWRPRVTLRDGLGETFQWFADRRPGVAGGGTTRASA